MNNKSSGIIVAIIAMAAFYFIFGSKGAVKYNNQLVDSQASVIKKLENLINAISRQQKDEIKLSFADLAVQIDGSINKVQSMKDFRGNTEFRDKTVDMLEFYGAITEQELKEIVDYHLNGTAAQNIQRISTLMQTVSQQETAYLKEFDKVQDRFAKEFNFKIEKRNR